MQVRLRSVRWEAEGIFSYRLEPLGGEKLPPFTAGAHIDIRLTDILSRSYSLLNDPADFDGYEIAVHLSRESRGGSSHIHEKWRAGDVVDIEPPKNDFLLNEDADHSVLIAGGIGITPLLCMVTRLQTIGRRFELHYSTRTRARAAFLDRLASNRQVRLAFSGEPDGGALDIGAIVSQAPACAHLYCCGPIRMMQAFQTATASRSPERVHVEYFSATQAPAIEGGYDVELRRSGKVVRVEPGQSMLQALLAGGANISYSCSEGVCGTCETGVLAGIPDHRDEFLTDDEKATNSTIMPCCSGSKTPRLVLDL
jgi:vanillate O-demethylase ferredoxin subunit